MSRPGSWPGVRSRRSRTDARASQEWSARCEWAVRRKHRDLVMLLLCNGYRLDLEADDGQSVLDEALRLRALDIVALLLKWGADPRTVETYSIIDTYRTDLMDRFWNAGVD